MRALSAGDHLRLRALVPDVDCGSPAFPSDSFISAACQTSWMKTVMTSEGCTQGLRGGEVLGGWVGGRRGGGAASGGAGAGAGERAGRGRGGRRGRGGGGGGSIAEGESGARPRAPAPRLGRPASCSCHPARTREAPWNSGQERNAGRMFEVVITPVDRPAAPRRSRTSSSRSTRGGPGRHHRRSAVPSATPTGSPRTRTRPRDPG